MTSQELKAQAQNAKGDTAALWHIAQHLASLAEEALGHSPNPPVKAPINPWGLALRYEQGWMEVDEAGFAKQLEQSYTGPKNPDGTAGAPVVKSFVSYDASTTAGVAILVAKYQFDPTGRQPDSPHIFIDATFEGAPLASAFHGIPPNNIVQQF